MIELKKLPLSRIHGKYGAQLVEYAGWEMPLKYSDIADEHMAVRNAAGIFDVSHMGEYKISGNGALDFLQKITSNDVSKLAVGAAQYSTVPNENGGTKDDVVVYRMGEQDYMLVCNAANVEKIGSWMKKNARDVEIEDITMTTVLLAVQGPKSLKLVQKISSIDLSQIKRFKWAWAEVAGIKVVASRSGYTGEDGIELYLYDVPPSDPAIAERLWEAIIKAGSEEGLKPCGLGTRDTTRLEAGLCLYGNDLNEEISPLEAKIDFVVKLEKGDFIGRQALLKQKENGLKRARVGLRMIDAGIPRKDYRIFKDGSEIGVVTSGTFSPLLKVGIAMGYVPPGIQIGDRVSIEIHGSQRMAEIVKLPFYDISKYGYSRVVNA